MARGCSEIALLGQNVNSYGKDPTQMLTLQTFIRMVNDIEGVERIRFMTSHPKDLSDKLIDAIAECDKVCETTSSSCSSRFKQDFERNEQKVRKKGLSCKD